MNTEPKRSDLIDKFWLDYGQTPGANELAHFQTFCDSIATIPVLRKVLDPSNHPATQSGRVFRPSVAILYKLRDGIIGELYREKEYREKQLQKATDRQIEMEAPSCLYCVDTTVYDLVWLKEKGRTWIKQGDSKGTFQERGRWSMEITGVCKHCSNGQAEPRTEIVAISQSSRAPCVEVIGRTMVDLYCFKLRTGSHAGKREVERGFGSGVTSPKLKPTPPAAEQPEGVPF